MIDMVQNQVMIDGVIEPQAVCASIVKKTKRVAKILSPPAQGEDEPICEVVASEVNLLCSCSIISY